MAGCDIECLIKDLPVFPDVVMEVLRLIDNPKSTNYIIAAAIKKDQNLAAKVLKIANSPFYGFPHRINTLSHAVLILGTNLIKGIILSTTLFEHIPSSAKALRQHGQNVATTTYNLINFTQGKQSHRELENIFEDSEELRGIFLNPIEPKEIPIITTAALLHDIGKTLIAIRLPDKFDEIQSIQKENKISSISAERKILGFDHIDVNRKICEIWNFPEDLQIPLTYHHLTLEEMIKEIKDETYLQYAALVHVADKIVNREY
ncbi:MAG: HDOD domain-containing protein [Candidatus Desulfofervidaceae bacterium]|nr:HDOD domain-containing protein [Candidatus Desulfofervidaceae bacterium]